MQLAIPQGDFRGFIFDVDGTLADSMPLHYRAWCAALRQHGAPFDFDEALFYSMGGTPPRDIVRSLAAKFQADLDPMAIAETKEDLFLSFLDDVRPIPEVVAFARAMAPAHPVSVASGGPLRVVEKTLRRIGAADVFDIIVTSDDVRRGKPFPDSFLLAAQRMGIPPGSCLVLEDSPTGEHAARAAGMACVLVPQPGR